MTCNWPTAEDCRPTNADAVKWGAAVELAQHVLWALSGRQFGACTTVFRPCTGVGSCVPPGRGGNVSHTCNAYGPGVVHLPGPVHKVLEVAVDGTAIDPDTYVVEGDILYRKTGNWPPQNLGRPLGTSGTWAVTYLRGYTPPGGVAAFVGTLAKEFYNACTGGKCKLPRRVQSISRQGVSFDMADPTDIFASGKTGFSEIDLWLSSVNPAGIVDAPRVR